MSLNTTNLKQKRGGRTIKQADRSSTFLFVLQDGQGREINLDGKKAQVSLHNPNNGRYWEVETTVKGSEVEFNLPGNLADDDYILEIASDGYVFPSDRDLIIRVTQGFKNLPDKETAERSERTLEEITADVQKQADENLKQTITIITNKKDQALKEIDTKAKTIADTVKADVAGLLKDLIFDSETKYQDDMVYVLDPYIEDGQVKFKPKEIGKLVANDFLRVNVDSDKYRFRIKSTNQGVILFYSMTDEDLRYAIHVYPQIKDYVIDFGKQVTGEMIFSTVSLPEDKVSIIREEGL